MEGNSAKSLAGVVVAMLGAGVVAVLGFSVLTALAPGQNADAVSTCAAMVGAPALAVFGGLLRVVG